MTSTERPTAVRTHFLWTAAAAAAAAAADSENPLVPPCSNDTRPQLDFNQAQQTEQRARRNQLAARPALSVCYGIASFSSSLFSAEGHQETRKKTRHLPKRGKTLTPRRSPRYSQ
jgi:hypothetical protein